MAQSKLHRNGIFTGYADSLCLVCECHLTSEHDACLHANNTDHMKKLDSVPFMEKYGDNNIRKVKCGYYCGFCNKLLKTGTKVELHVTETDHKKKQGSCHFKHSGTSVAYKNVMISANAWHGVAEDSCCICNSDIDDFNTHVQETVHIINLIQSEIQFGENDYLYRLLDNDFFQCLTCNKVLPLNIITEHFKSTKHQTVYANTISSEQNEITNEYVSDDNSQVETKLNSDLLEKNQAVGMEKELNIELTKNNHAEENVDNNYSQTGTNVNSDSFEENEAVVTEKNIELMKQNHVEENGDNNSKIKTKSNRDSLEKYQAVIVKETNIKPTKQNEEETIVANKILDSVHIIQKSEINVNFETKTAFCKRCLVNIDFNYITLEHHMQSHKISTKIVQSPLAYPSTPGGQSKEVFRKSEQIRKPNILRALTYNENDNVLLKSEEEETIDFNVSGPEVDEITDSEINNNDHTSTSNNETKKQNTDPDIEANDFAKTHNITYNAVNRIAYCRFCEARVPPTLQAIKEHVAGAAHKIQSKKIKKSSPKVSTSKVPVSNIPITNGRFPYIPLSTKSSEHFVQELISCKTSNDLIINREYCVTVLSFCMITKEGAGFQCHACSTHISARRGEVNKHLDTKLHDKKIKSVPVILMMANMGNFVREVRPNVYHCAPCNEVVHGVPDLCDHITTPTHKKEKAFDEMRLQALLRDYHEEQIMHLVFNSMFRNPFF